VKNALKGKRPTMFFFFVTQHTRGREKEEERMKEKRKKKGNLTDQLTIQRHLAPMAYQSAHPIPKGLFITAMPRKIGEKRLHAFLVSALRVVRPASHSLRFTFE
jgi:hypothetical protein